MAKRCFTTIMLVGCISLPVWADGFYGAADVGRVKWSADNGGSYTDGTFLLGAGYRWSLPFEDKVALELSYRQLGESHVTNIDGDYRYQLGATQLSAIASHSFTDRASYYGRLGYADVSVDMKLSTAESSAKDSRSHERAYGGVGLNYQVDNHWGAYLEYNRYADVETLTLSTLTMGVNYHF